MDPQLKNDIIDIMFNRYDLDGYQKDCIMRMIDSCIDLATYQNGNLAEKKLNTIAGLIRGHIINLLNVLGVEKDVKRKFETAES